MSNIRVNFVIKKPHLKKTQVNINTFSSAKASMPRRFISDLRKLLPILNKLL